MYVKILTRETDTNPERSVTILDVDEVEFFECKLDSKEYQAFCEGATHVWVSERDSDKLPEDPKTGCLSITKANGKNEFIMFDRVAFLCNEQGKAVERYRVS